MARARLSFSCLALALLLGAAAPAFAQFGGIFRDEPPRPPADVPNAPASNIPPSADLPPAQPLPAPMSLPPSSRPGAGGIESAPLAPLPPPQEQPQQGVSTNPGQTLPGLPPGQKQPRGGPQPANTAPQPGDEVVVEPPPQRIANPQAVFNGLDKITGRIISFDVAINETVQFGALQVTPRVCYSRPPTETPNTDSFVEVEEVTLQGEIKRIFDGWMFAASPGLHAVDHPVYDVWLTDCKGGQGPAVAEAPSDPTLKQPAAKQAAPKQPAAPKPVQPPVQQPRAQQDQGFLPALR
jgi:hypothetical protein